MRSHSLVVARSVRLRLAVGALVAISSILAVGCMERRTAALQPRLGFGQEVRVRNSGYRNVDLLLVVDDSNSMEEEQGNLAAQIPLLVHDLTTPPDRDGDGQGDWGAAERVRIAVVNTDLGTSGATPPSGIGSWCSGWGDDGAWQASADCGAVPALQVFTATDDPDAFATRIGCLVESLGIEGCGIEQQLGAAAKGVELGEASGFPAADAMFAVLMLTDEEDCTLEDPSAFFGAFSSSNANVLCQRAAQGVEGAQSAWLTSIDALVARMSAGRDESGFVFAAITGIPTELEGVTPADILGDDAMRYREQISPTTRQLEPVPACETSLGRAAPARRIVELAGRFPGSVLRSICTDDFRPAVQELVARIAERLPGVCLTRAIPRVGARVDCRMEEVLPEGLACTSIPGHQPIGLDGTGREVCLIDQVYEGGPTEGFFYDDTDATCAQLAFTDAAIPPLGAAITVDCYFEVPTEGGGPLGP